MLSKEEINGFDVKSFDDSSVKNDCSIVVVAHDKFKKMTLESIKRFMNDRPVLIDVKGCFDRRAVEERGFIYRCL